MDKAWTRLRPSGQYRILRGFQGWWLANFAAVVGPFNKLGNVLILIDPNVRSEERRYVSCASRPLRGKIYRHSKAETRDDLRIGFGHVECSVIGHSPRSISSCVSGARKASQSELSLVRPYKRSLWSDPRLSIAPSHFGTLSQYSGVVGSR